MKIIFILFLLPGFASLAKRAGCEESSDRKYEGKNGERNGAIPCLDPNGKLVRKTSWVDGRQNGPELTYDATGQLLEESNWKDNKKDGTTKKYSPRSHKVIAETAFQNDERNGRDEEWFDEPTYGLKKRQTFKEDTLDGAYAEYSSPNKLMKEGTYKSGQMDGDWKFYDPSGSLVSRANFRRGVRDGIEHTYDPGTKKEVKTTCFVNGTTVAGLATCGGNPSVVSGNVESQYEKFPNGKIRSEWQVKNGKKDGIAKIYFESGQLAEQYTYVNGEKNGPAKTFFEDGKLDEEASFRNGQFDGELKSYFSDTGAIKSDVFWKNGKKDGQSRQFYMNGHVSSEMVFANGHARLEKDYYDDGKNQTEEHWDENDNQTGIYKSWAKAGDLTEESLYNKGVRDGTSVRYHADGVIKETFSKGVLTFRETLLNGQSPKKEKFYPDGSKVEK